MTISQEGIKPKDEKLNDFKNAKQPANAKELRSFLGLATYFSNRIPKLSETGECLRQLLRQNVQYNWMPEHEIAFNKIKNDLLQYMLYRISI